MAKNRVWLCDKKFYQTTECMIMVALATDMDCRYHPRIYLKWKPSDLWHCHAEGRILV